MVDLAAALHTDRRRAHVMGFSQSEQDGQHTATRWVTPSGTVFEFWAHDYEASSPSLRGHCSPGSPQLVAFPVAFGCADQGTFDYAARALDFFAAHPGPPRRPAGSRLDVAQRGAYRRTGRPARRPRSRRRTQCSGRALSVGSFRRLEIRIPVTITPWFFEHGTILSNTATATVSYSDAGGVARTASATASHDMRLRAIPALAVVVPANNTTRAYTEWSIMGPDGQPGVSFYYRIPIANTGTAPLRDVATTMDLPAGFLWTGNPAPLMAWGFDPAPVPWSGDPLHVTVGGLGHMNYIAFQLWASCDQLAGLRNADGTVPPDLLNPMRLRASAIGPDDNDQPVAVDRDVVWPGFAPPNLSKWVCGETMEGVKFMPYAQPPADGNVRWPIVFRPPIGVTQVSAAVVWDELDPTQARFSGVSDVVVEARVTVYRRLLEGDRIACLHEGHLVDLAPVDLAANAHARRARATSDEDVAHPLPPRAADIAFQRDFAPVVDADGGHREDLVPKE